MAGRAVHYPILPQASRIHLLQLFSKNGNGVRLPKYVRIAVMRDGLQDFCVARERIGGVLGFHAITDKYTCTRPVEYLDIDARLGRAG